MLKLPLLLFALAYSLFAAAPPKSLNPQVQEVVSGVSVDHIAAIEKKLESFGTRNIFSSIDDPTHGVGAAREWIADQFKSYSPRLQVSFDKHRLAKQTTRMPGKVEIWNVVAVPPGAQEPEEQVLVTGHYDTINLVYQKGALGKRQIDAEATAKAPAPGVTDDGSGTAAVMELARVMSAYRFRKTIVFIAFAAEEYGLYGSGLYAEQAAARHDHIEGVFNNDIIGSDVSGNGNSTNRRVNVYSAEPDDSTSRELARYFKAMAERYQPGFSVELILRHDRFGRGGDHSSFNAVGFPAVRVTTASENYSNQHTATDTFANTSPNYATSVAKANAAAAASLATAPKAPVITVSGPSEGRSFGSALGRGTMPDGTSGYDAVLQWSSPKPEPDLWGYSVLIRKTTSPEWEREVYVGNTLQYVLPNLSIDEVVLGVKAIDKDGNESAVSAFVTQPYQKKKIETY